MTTDTNTTPENRLANIERNTAICAHAVEVASITGPIVAAILVVSVAGLYLFG